MERLEILTNREEIKRVWNMQKRIMKISWAPALVIGSAIAYIERYQPEIFRDILEKIDYFFPHPYTLIQNLFN